MAFMPAIASAGTPESVQLARPPGRSPRVNAIRHRGELRSRCWMSIPVLKNETGAAQPFAGSVWSLAEHFPYRLSVRVRDRGRFSMNISVVTTGQVDITIAPLLATLKREQQVDMIDC